MKQYKFIDKRAFTLVEMIVALFVTTLVCLMIFSSISTIATYKTKQVSYLSDFSRCRTQMESCFGEEVFDNISHKTIMMKKEDTIVRYEQYKNMIRRTTNKGGHEPLALYVKNWHVEQVEDYIHMRIFFENGEVYEGDIFIQKNQKE